MDNEYCRIPDCESSPHEISKMMRINLDILKEELTLHIDLELARFRHELDKLKLEKLKNGS